MSNQKYKIFVNSKVVYLVSNPAKVNEIVSSEEHFIIQPYKKKEWDNLLQVILGPNNSSHVVIYHDDVTELLGIFRSHFEPVIAAGGVVLNPRQQILMIFRRGFWDLPKGKIDQGESLEACAIREVKEETGITKLSLLHPIDFPGLHQECTYHVYFEKGKWLLKSSFWYLMETDLEQVLVPQVEEDIEALKWVSLEEAKQLTPIYASVRDVLYAASGK